MARVEKAAVAAVASTLADLRALYERSAGGTGVDLVIANDDGSLPRMTSAKMNFVIVPVPSGSFIPVATGGAEAASGSMPIKYRNMARGRWYFRTIGITMCRQYREESLPPEQWIPYIDMPEYVGAPKPPARHVVVAADGSWTPAKKTGLTPFQEMLAPNMGEYLDRVAAEIAEERKGARILTKKESDAILARGREWEAPHPVESAPEPPAPAVATIAVPAATTPPVVNLRRVDPNTPIRFGGTR